MVIAIGPPDYGDNDNKAKCSMCYCLLTCCLTSDKFILYLISLLNYSGPTLFMVLTREDAVTGWKALMGPTDPLQALEVAPDS